MANVLYLAHRLPYPPDKGDKLRSFHVLRELCARHQVFLGTFVDDPDDLRHVQEVERQCQEVRAIRLRPFQARIRALGGIVRGQPLTLAYYRDSGLSAWVHDLRERRRVDAVVVSSSSMAPYAEGFDQPFLMDFIDVDSLKWRAYADTVRGLAQWVFRREARTLLAFERRVAAQATRSFFVTRREVDLFRELAPEVGPRVQVMENGVDSGYFAPDPERPSPYPAGELAITFTGTMNYRPNVDAVLWFVREVLPRLRARRPNLRLTVVGRHPAVELRRLQGQGVRVTGAVDDTRPWVQHASLVVAPMRIARGVQNKILEAMAMGRPLVAAHACADALDVEPGVHLAVATAAEDYERVIEDLLADPAAAQRMGLAARRHMRQRYAWSRSLQPLHASLPVGTHHEC